MRSVAAILALGACLLADASNAQAESVAGRPVQSVYGARSSSCEPGFIPDAPARAFRRYDGVTVLLASSDENWELVGPSITRVQAVCQPTFRSSAAANSIGSVWIEATYTTDGRIIDALGSRALPDSRGQGCRFTGPGACWLNDIVSLRSTDGGRHYVLGPTVAAFRATYDPGRALRLGFFTVSNIVLWQGGFYAVVAWALGSGDTQNCLLRNQVIDDPSSWRAWDGKDFILDVSHASPIRPPCAAISAETLSQEVRSISYSSRSRRWAAIFADARRAPGTQRTVQGAYVSHSADLIHWGAASLIMALPLSRDPARCNDFIRYPSLLDPKSRSRNFSTLDDATALLFFTYEHVRHCAGSLDRDLDVMEVPVSAID